MSEKFSIGTKTPIKQTNKNSIFKRGNKSTQRYKRGEVHIGGFELNTVYVLFSTRYIFTLSSRSQKLIIVISYLLEFLENLKS